MWKLNHFFSFDILYLLKEVDFTFKTKQWEPCFLSKGFSTMIRVSLDSLRIISGSKIDGSILGEILDLFLADADIFAKSVTLWQIGGKMEILRLVN